MRIKCLLCNDIIEGDGKGNLIYCKCKQSSIDQNEYGLTRINGIEHIIEVDENGNEIFYTFKDEEKLPSRIDKINYYLDIAETTSERATCLKRRYGSIIVKNDSLIASGFNGSPRGMQSCLDMNRCMRANAERGTDYSSCTSIHSEQNAIIHASREQMLNSDLYLVGIEQSTGNYVENAEPCSLCKRFIINAGIKNVYVRVNKTEYKLFKVDDWKKDISSIIGGY